jgi:hypothetical protein
MKDDRASSTSGAARSRRAFTVTAHVTVDADADLDDPLIRVAYVRALVAQLTAEPWPLDIAFGTGSARIGTVTAAS